MRFMRRLNPFRRRYRIRIVGPCQVEEPEPEPESYLPGHILTDAVPETAPERPPVCPDPDVLEKTADSQLGAGLLRLPIEVRLQIYDELWEDAGYTRHVYVKNGAYTHTKCITDHDAADERQIEVKKIYPMSERLLQHPAWSRRLVSSWVNHWRCEEAAVAAMTDGSPLPTPFLALLLCCKRMYLDCRQPLYERLTFTFHRVETALDFLSERNVIILPEIKSLQLSVQLDVRENRPGPAWHARVRAWTDLRKRLSSLSNPTRVSIWMDAGKPELRRDLPDETELFDFDEHLTPVLRLSMPIYDRGDGNYIPIFQPRDYTVVGRGLSHWWQEPRIEPSITWCTGWGYPDLYDREDDHLDVSEQH